jgi:hypothetical protein
MTCEIISRVFEKTSEDYLEISKIKSDKICQEVLNEMSAKILKKMMESLPEILPDKIYDIIYY